MSSRIVRTALCLPFCAVATPIPGEKNWSHYTYEQYLTDFGKNDNGLTRKAVFESNLKRINKHNAQDGKSWFATVNDFTVLSAEEFKKFVKGKSLDLGMPGQLGTYMRESIRLSDLPARLDWREKAGVVTPVKDQGGCGSCWAFSATESFESHLAIATGERAPELSPQQIVSCSPDPKKCGGSGGCDGSTEPLAFNYTKTAGLTTEESYPYQGVTGTCQTSKIKPVGYNSGYVELPPNNYTALITAVATKGPMSIGVAAGGFGWQIYGGGVMSGSNNYDMDHGVNLVGYGTDGSKDYWLVRNSWNAGWGEKGYIRLQRYGEGKEPCGMDNTPGDGDACAGDTKPRKYCGECAIMSSTSYPSGLRKATDAIAV